MFHYHITKLRCPKCTIEWAVYIACDYPAEIIRCEECGHVPMKILEENNKAETPTNLLIAGRTYHCVRMPNQLTLKQLAEKLGIDA